METLTLAFIKNQNGFTPAHISQINKDDVYYLVIDGKPTGYFRATENASQDNQHNWKIAGAPAEQK